MIRLALALVLLLAGLQLTGLSSAAFTDSETEDPAAFAGGTLEVGVDDAASSALDAANMRPGGTRTATYALKNSGTVGSTLSIGIEDVADVPASAGLSAVLELKLEDCGTTAACAAPAALYTGSVRDFTGASAGTIAPGATRRVRVTLSWGADKNDPSRQGAATTATLLWRAVAGTSK